MPADFGGLLGRAKSAGQGMSTPAVKPLPPMPEEPELEGEEDPMLVRLQPIAQDLIDAIRGGDAKAVAEAWMAGHDAIGAGPSESESEIEE